ncbi:GAF domain-containing protein [Pseudogemmobacter humi]|uniref:Phytochrome-like protein cph1 n=1 Tax=Pseudogemmobacter humi TaxID=2483812 RepID=A0A3P5XFV2_9RHOB|nr:GAF domain-containing protein [Pseudogemmobacter humi]VDC33654.1 Phytochrome-like protein cph1 [Pseudogemmobacter humi]
MAEDAGGPAGAILPHGAMLVCDPVSLELRCVSQNFRGITRFGGDLFPGLALADILGAAAVHDLRNAAARAGGGPERQGMIAGLRLPCAMGAFDAAIHTHAGAMIVELEPAEPGGQSAEQTLDLLRHMVLRLAQVSDPARLFTMAARLMQAMLGFDRVTVSRFAAEGPEVLASAQLSGAAGPSAAGLPGAVCPGPPLRLIPDTGAAPVRLEPAQGPPPDLAHAWLRVAAPGPLADLRAQGIGAVLTLAVMCGNEPWGTIACHNAAPKTVPLALRIAAELFGQYFALQIAAAGRGLR